MASNNVSIHTTTNTAVSSPIPVGTNPHGVAVNPSGTRVYVTNFGSHTFSAIDTTTNTVIGSPVSVGGNPEGVAVNPSGTRVYVVSSSSGTVSVIDTETNTVVGSPISVGAGAVAFGQFIVPPQAFTVWTGVISFSNKITVPYEDTSGNKKFKSFTNPFIGTVELYVGENGLVSNGEGCHIKFLGEDGSGICIKQIAVISTDVHKNRTDQALLIGTGDMTIPMEGIPKAGIVYFDAKGTLKKDNSGEITSLSLSGKITGGSEELYVASGSFRTTLTKVSQ